MKIITSVQGGGITMYLTSFTLDCSRLHVSWSSCRDKAAKMQPAHAEIVLFMVQRWNDSKPVRNNTQLSTQDIPQHASNSTPSAH